MLYSSLVDLVFVHFRPREEHCLNMCSEHNNFTSVICASHHSQNFETEISLLHNTLSPTRLQVHRTHFPAMSTGTPPRQKNVTAKRKRTNKIFSLSFYVGHFKHEKGIQIQIHRKNCQCCPGSLIVTQ